VVLGFGDAGEAMLVEGGSAAKKQLQYEHWTGRQREQ
jgi:hypothetical protein